MLKKIALLVMLLSLVAGCSDSDQQQPVAEPELKSEEPASKPYQLVESFNVGENVFVRSLEADESTNSLWVGTSIGVLQVSLGTNEVLNTFTRADGLANEFVFSIFADSQGYKWMGTDGGGMSRFRDGEWKTYFPMHGLADYWVYSFTEQKDGTIWVGTWAGLNRIDGKTEVFTTYLEELVNEWVYGLDVDKHDQVWIGTEGGVNMFDGETWHTWTHDDGLGAANANGLTVSDNTGLGTRSRHDLSVMAFGQETYNPNYVFDIMVAQDGAVWAGTWGGGASRFDGKVWANYTDRQGLAGNIVYSVAQGPDGRLWFGTNRGLSSFDGKQWQTYTRADGLLDNNVYTVVVTSDGSVWAGTRNGVALLKK